MGSAVLSAPHLQAASQLPGHHAPLYQNCHATHRQRQCYQLDLINITVNLFFNYYYSFIFNVTHGPLGQIKYNHFLPARQMSFPPATIWLNEREAMLLASFLTNSLSAQRQHPVSPAQSPTSCLPTGRQSSAQCRSQSI